MGDVWALRIAGIIAASLTICFVALAILADPARGPFIEVVVAGVGVSGGAADRVEPSAEAPRFVSAGSVSTAAKPALPLWRV